MILSEFKPAAATAMPAVGDVPGGLAAAPNKGGAGPTEAEALKGGEGARLNTLSLTDYVKGSATSAGSAIGNQQSVGSIVDAKIVLSVADALIPALIVIGFGMAKIPVKSGDFKLTAKEQDVLAIPLQRCLESLMVNFNSPWSALAVTALGIYGAKMAEHGFKAGQEKKANEKVAKEAQAKDAAKSATHITSAGEVVKIDPKAAQTTEFGTGLRPWDANDLAKVMGRRKKPRGECIKWLNENWEKRGGAI